MDKDYNRKELERKKIPELKQILKNRNLKLAGNKDELIDRILDDQSQNPKQPTEIKPKRDDLGYLDILPRDITNIVNKYRVENEPNNVIIYQLLERVLKNNPNKEMIEEIEEFLKDNDIPFQLIKNRKREKLKKEAEEQIKIKETKGKLMGKNYIYSKLGVYDLPVYEPNLTKDIVINNEELMKFVLDFIVLTKLDIGAINKILKDNNSKLVLIKINDDPKPGQKTERYHYYIGTFQPLMDIAR